jgi:hypothetical protein
MLLKPIANQNFFAKEAKYGDKYDGFLGGTLFEI